MHIKDGDNIISIVCARIKVFTEIIKNGTPIIIRAIPKIDRSQYGTKPIWKTGWK